MIGCGGGRLRFFSANSEGGGLSSSTMSHALPERLLIPHAPPAMAARGQTNFRSLATICRPRAIRTTLAFAVTAGLGADELVRRFEVDHDDYNSIMAKALADRLAEAFAELLHERALREWHFGRDDKPTKDYLLAEKYRGIRPAAGYPSCPDHTEKQTLWSLLKPDEAAGIQLTESFAMLPAASVSGLYFSHPEARYFAVDLVTKDQVEQYARRKGMPLGEVERWLAPNLSYDVD